ncbi:MAG: lactate racemase domain-containing protein [Sedimentisphaerales bacterium]|nr:lactate racemase domain-containing protein [Sedimentisphaerales bacterium]
MLDKKAKNKNTINIPYENSFIELPIFSNAEIIELIPPYIEPLNHQQILHSLKNPVGNAPLLEIAIGKNNVLIILENATRPLDTSFIASLVVDELRQADVADENITFLFANGAHKDMEEYNYKDKLGSRFKNFRIINHDCEGELVNLGITKLGSPILINPLVLEADLKIAIGTIEPHLGDGFSGGAKILFPGCAGLEWIFNNHSLKRGEFGEVENQWRNDTEESAGKVGIDFLVNAVLNYKREIIGLYCGDLIKAHREGASLSLKAAVAELPYQADFCIASSSPIDLNFLQTLKSIAAARTVIKENGTYIMLTSSRQGLGNHRWLLDDKMLEERHKLNTDYNSAMTEIIYSTHLSEEDLYSYYPKQVKLINDIDKLRQMVASLDKPDKKGIVLPYSPITILQYP